VTSATTPQAVVDALRVALAQVLRPSAAPTPWAPLRLTGVSVLPSSDYTAMTEAAPQTMLGGGVLVDPRAG
jgi:hypothetical protein